MGWAERGEEEEGSHCRFRAKSGDVAKAPHRSPDSRPARPAHSPAPLTTTTTRTVPPRSARRGRPGLWSLAMMEQRWRTLLLLPLLVLLLPMASHCEVFTSIGQMTDLVFMEKDLLISLNDYIQAEESKLGRIKRWVEKVQRVMEKATSDPETFLGHPINAYQLVKRMSHGWAQLESMVLQDTTEGFVSNLTAQRQYFPTDEDQSGAAKALLRLQDTYRLEARTMANGLLPGVTEPQRARLSVHDCFQLGRISYTASDYYHTVPWMEQTLRMIDEFDAAGTTGAEAEAPGSAGAGLVGTDEPPGRAEVLDYLSYSVYQLGDVERALALTHQLLANDPGHQRAQGNVRYFDYVLEQKRKSGNTSKVEASRPPDAYPERYAYEKLCRGEGIKMTSRRRRRLSCRFQDGGRNPRLLLSPAREEEEWDRPRIVRYHGVISDGEMQRIKELAKPRLQRATVKNPQTGVLETADYRVSKSAWLGEEEDPLIARLNQRIEDVTGLNMRTAEDLQVANYGMGGQYEPHFDFARKEEPDAFERLGTGNRIATWLFYMSDVPSGGATVFPEVGASVMPKKGTAVFWYNLFASGEGDYSTRHAACPVLVGNKWVSNKWIHERGQEFRRKCGMTETA
ncbi:prolyl 4-hydroxylase subunit alpha-1 isoform X2 [Lethenteron reissneri]|uniref:prolyl 4-hydroxylase subunit alpha-1 isoform X2 n=1 Tax=Lethenteron reissneri TaxID=7753 RepID=UPI002AB70FDE|nr:prolyl 4-hydroxylase subunit alpha-1 isoform X2 [Lethenteron reissneri]